MDRRTLGSRGPDISVVGYGAWEAGGDMWGPNESEDAVVRAMQAAIDAGMSWIDTAEVYGDGRSEELVAKAVQGRRDEVLIFTKVAPEPAGTGFRAEQVKRAIRASLERLGTDHVDLYQLHWPDDRGVPVEETWGAMAEIRDQGLTRWIGVSNFDRDLIERCLPIAHVDSVQNQLSLFRRDDVGELLPWLEERGIGYLAYSALAYGLLTGAITAETRFSEDDWRSGVKSQSPSYRRLFAPGVRERNLERVERMRPIAERLGTSLAALALRWVVEQTGVTAAIAGSRNERHVRANAEAGDLKLSAEDLQELDEIFAA